MPYFVNIIDTNINSIKQNIKQKKITVKNIDALILIGKNEFIDASCWQNSRCIDVFRCSCFFYRIDIKISMFLTSLGYFC